jgi:hypothetical protein
VQNKIEKQINICDFNDIDKFILLIEYSMQVF